MQPEETFWPIVQGSFVPWIGIACPCSPARDREAGAERVVLAAVHTDSTRQLHHALADFRLPLQGADTSPAIPVCCESLPCLTSRSLPRRRLPRSEWLAIVLYEIKEVTAGIDHDGARRLAKPLAHDCAGKGGIWQSRRLRSRGSAPAQARSEAGNAQPRNNRTTARHCPHPHITPNTTQRGAWLNR